MSIFAWHFINTAILIGIKKYYWHMEKQKVIISRNLEENLTKAIEECKHDRLFVLMDETTGKCCWDVVKNFDCVKNAERIVIGETDAAKNLDTLAYVWKRLFLNCSHDYRIHAQYRAQEQPVSVCLHSFPS